MDHGSGDKGIFCRRYGSSRNDGHKTFPAVIRSVSASARAARIMPNGGWWKRRIKKTHLYDLPSASSSR
jgi:hypothetical protein